MARRDRDKQPRRGLTKADLTDAVYERHGALTKNEAADIVDAIFKTVKTTLGDGRPVKIKNFGTFEVQRRKGRMGVNPSSGERMFIPPRNGLAFRPSDRLKVVLPEKVKGGGKSKAKGSEKGGSSKGRRRSESDGS